VSFRIGHMGDYDAADILSVVGALEDVLASLGLPVVAGAGVAAAQTALSEPLAGGARAGAVGAGRAT
jgi:aspartate aminotransferase-like enzyme